MKCSIDFTEKVLPEQNSDPNSSASFSCAFWPWVGQFRHTTCANIEFCDVLWPRETLQITMAAMVLLNCMKNSRFYKIVNRF